MVMQNARNNPALKRIKAAMNSKIYMGALRVMNEEGEEACRRYMGQFFNAERREESLRELFGKSLTPDVHIKTLRVKYGKAIDYDRPILRDYYTNKEIRNATADELEESRNAAKYDGGAGVIDVNGRSCYVEE